VMVPPRSGVKCWVEHGDLSFSGPVGRIIRFFKSPRSVPLTSYPSPTEAILRAIRRRLGCSMMKPKHLVCRSC